MLGRHAVTDGHSGVLTTSLLLLLLLLLEVLVVGHLLLLLVGHVGRVHTARSWDIRLLSVDIVVADIFRCLSWDLGDIDTVLVGSGIGSVEAGLGVPVR